MPFKDSERLHKLEETLFDPPHPPADKDVFDYCKLFIQEYGSPLFQPFIADDSDFSEEPAGYPEKLETACALWKNLVPESDGEPKRRSNKPPEEKQVQKEIAKLVVPLRTARKAPRSRKTVIDQA